MEMELEVGSPAVSWHWTMRGRTPSSLVSFSSLQLLTGIITVSNSSLRCNITKTSSFLFRDPSARSFYTSHYTYCVTAPFLVETLHHSSDCVLISFICGFNLLEEKCSLKPIIALFNHNFLTMTKNGRHFQSSCIFYGPSFIKSNT